MTSVDNSEKSLTQRFRAEMREYMIISVYLWLCFSTILLYEGTVLSEGGAQMLPLGIAVIKALVLGKFILIGKAFGVGDTVRHTVLIHRIIWKSLAMLLLLVFFTGIEELVVGLFHDKSISEIVTDVTAIPPLHKLASSLLMLMVLIPMITFEEVDRVLGEGGLSRMLFGSSDSE